MSVPAAPDTPSPPTGNPTALAQGLNTDMGIGSLMKQRLAAGQQQQQDITKLGQLTAQKDEQEAQGNAAVTSQISGEAHGYTDALNKQLSDNPLPTYVPTQETAPEIAGLFGLIQMTGALLGKAGGGQQSALRAMDAMTGMLTGWQDGREALYEKNRQDFEESLKDVQAKRQQLLDEYKRYMDLLPIDAAKAKADMSVALAKYAGPVTQQAFKVQGDAALIPTMDALMKGAEVEDNIKYHLEDLALKRLAATQVDQLDENTLTLAAQNLHAGDGTLLRELLGFSKNRPAIVGQVLAKMQQLYPNTSGDQLAALKAQFTGAQAGARNLGTNVARIETALNEIEPLSKAALAAAAKLDPSSYPSINTVKQAIARGTGDKNVVQLKDFIAALQSAYSQMAQRGGAITNRARDISDQVISGNLSLDQMQGAIDALKQEGEIAKRAAKAALQDVSGFTAGAGGTSPARKFSTEQEVKDAYQSGALTKDEATQILQSQFGYQ